jgi:hypothetical protein
MFSQRPSWVEQAGAQPASDNYSAIYDSGASINDADRTHGSFPQPGLNTGVPTSGISGEQSCLFECIATHTDLSRSSDSTSESEHRIC